MRRMENGFLLVVSGKYTGLSRNVQPQYTHAELHAMATIDSTFSDTDRRSINNCVEVKAVHTRAANPAQLGLLVDSE